MELWKNSVGEKLWGLMLELEFDFMDCVLSCYWLSLMCNVFGLAYLVLFVSFILASTELFIWFWDPDSSEMDSLLSRAQ